MNKVYLVFNYSACSCAYEVHHIASTREQAEYAKNFYDSHDIKEFIVDDIPEHKTSKLFFDVSMNKKGEEMGFWRAMRSQFDWPKYKREDCFAKDHRMLFKVQANNIDEAKSEVHKMRLSLIESGEWDKIMNGENDET